MSKKMVPLIWGVIIGGIGIWSIFGMTSGLKYLIGPVCLFSGWHSLKAAVFMTDTEIDEFTNPNASVSQKTRKKFEDL